MQFFLTYAKDITGIRWTALTKGFAAAEISAAAKN